VCEGNGILHTPVSPRLAHSSSFSPFRRSDPPPSFTATRFDDGILPTPHFSTRLPSLFSLRRSGSFPTRSVPPQQASSTPVACSSPSRPSTGKGKREGGLSTNVLEQGMTMSAAVAACQKRLSLQNSERGGYFHTNPPARVGDLIFNTNPQCPGEIAGDCVTLTTKFDAGRPMSCPCCRCTFSLRLLSIVV